MPLALDAGGGEREREKKKERERDPGLDCTVHVQDERQEKKQTIGLPADKPDGPGRDAARALASSVWTADWNSAREKVTDVAVDEGTEVDAEEPVADVDPDDDMTIDLGRATIHLDNENRKNEESSLTQH